MYISSKKRLFVLCLFSLLFINNLFSYSFFDYPISTLVLDAGHGGKDSGAIASYSFNDNIYEKDIVLNFSLLLEEKIKEELPSLNIIQTRDDDTYLSLQQRSEKGYNYILDDNTSSLYISIHANAASNTNAKGFEIFTKLQNKVIFLVDEKTPLENIDLFANENIYTLNRKQYMTSYDLASSILNFVIDDVPNIKNRGIKSNDLYVLNVCRTTGCLIELGFISNEEEAKLLLDPIYVDQLATAISKGIVNYIKNRR